MSAKVQALKPDTEEATEAGVAFTSTFTLERSTKGTHVYKETTEPASIGSLYIRKTAPGFTTAPQTISVTVTVG